MRMYKHAGKLFHPVLQNKNILLLSIIVGIGAYVRFWGIDFGLPYIKGRPDESLLVDISFGFGSGSLHPHYFIYSTLYMYLSFVLYVGYFLIGLACRMFTSPSDLIAIYSLDPTIFYIISRCLSAFMGVFTIYIVYRISRDWFEEKTGLVAAFFLSLAFLHVRDSHFAITDITMTFFIMTSFLFIIRCRNTAGIKNYVFAGIFAGLAASTKYAGIILAGPMALVHFLNVLDERPVLWRNFLDKRAGLFLTGFILAFLAGTPYALLDFSAFLGGLTYDAKHLTAGGVEHIFVLERGWLYHLKYSLPYGLGWSLFCASFAGFAVLMKLDIRKALVLFAFPLLFYIPAGLGKFSTVRYMIPLTPFFCIAGAVFTVKLCNLLTGNMKPRLKNSIIFIAAVLIIAPSMYSVVQFDKLLSQKDNRLIATEWVLDNIPEGSSVYQRGLPPLQFPRLLKDLEEDYQKKEAAGIHDRKLKIRIEDMRSRQLTGYRKWGSNLDGTKMMYNNVVQTSLPDYIILGLSPLIYHSNIPDDIQQALKDSYILKKSFIAVDMTVNDRWYDLPDAFYLPFKGFKGVERPGPNLYIYEKNEKQKVARDDELSSAHKKIHRSDTSCTLAEFDVSENWVPDKKTTLWHDSTESISVRAPWGGKAHIVKNFDPPLDLQKKHFGLRYKSPLLSGDPSRPRLFSEVWSCFNFTTHFHFKWEFYVKFISEKGSTLMRLDPADQVKGWFMLPFSKESVFMNGGSEENGGVDWSAVTKIAIIFKGKNISFSAHDVQIHRNTITIKDDRCVVDAIFHTGTPVRFVGNNLPAPLRQERTYYVISDGKDPQTFMFSESADGKPIKISGAGRGEMSVVTAPKIVFDKLIAVNSTPKAYIVLRFDDGFETTYSIAKPKMDTYGFKGVFCIVSDNHQAVESPTLSPEFCVDCGDDNFVSWLTLDAMRREGWDIISHTHNHSPLGDLSEKGGAQPDPPSRKGVWTENDVRFQLGQSKRELLLHGHAKGARFVAYTYGPTSTLSDITYKLISEYYALGSHTVPFGINSLPLINPYYFGVLPVEHDDAFEGGDTQKAIDRVCNQGGLLVLLLHKIYGQTRRQSFFEDIHNYIFPWLKGRLLHKLQKQYGPSRSQSFFEEMVDYIAIKQQLHSNPPEVITFSELYDRIISTEQISQHYHQARNEPFVPVAHYWYNVTLTASDSFTTVFLDAQDRDLHITLPPLSENCSREFNLKAGTVGSHIITVHSGQNDMLLLNCQRLHKSSKTLLLNTKGDFFRIVGDCDNGTWQVTRVL